MRKTGHECISQREIFRSFTSWSNSCMFASTPHLLPWKAHFTNLEYIGAFKISGSNKKLPSPEPAQHCVLYWICNGLKLVNVAHTRFHFIFPVQCENSPAAEGWKSDYESVATQQCDGFRIYSKTYCGIPYKISLLSASHRWPETQLLPSTAAKRRDSRRAMS